MPLVEHVKKVAEHYETTPGAAAVAWTLRHPAGEIVGFRRPDQIDPILPAASLELSDDYIDQFEGGTG